jgi:hypothetical protein
LAFGTRLESPMGDDNELGKGKVNTVVKHDDINLWDIVMMMMMMMLLAFILQ